MLLQIPKIKRSPKPEPFLRWLFVAKFSDGHTIHQTQEDKCYTRNDGTGSAFTDVLAYKEAPLISFGLEHVIGKESAYVDLISGNFEVNGTPICVHNQFFEPHKYPLKLIYFREARAETTIQATVLEDMTVEQKQFGRPKHYVNRYFIGWETVVNGKNKQVTLAVG